MLMGKLLVRGMLVGLVAGLLTFGLARIVGEPAIGKAIEYEATIDKQKADAKFRADVDAAKAAHGPLPARPEEEPELVARWVQSTFGLFTGVMIVGAALGGIFSLVFAFAYGRIATIGPRATAAVVAALGYVSIFFIPNLKYPSSPPSVGEAATIGARTGLYFSMILLSVIAMVLAVMLRKRLTQRLGAWNSTIAAGVAYIALMLVVGFGLPTVSEVPETFSAVVLWDFRMSTIAMQAVLWSIIGLAFGAVAEPALIRFGRGAVAARAV